MIHFRKKLSAHVPPKTAVPAHTASEAAVPAHTAHEADSYLVRLAK